MRRWWQNKVDEIYRYIPDFGGLLVKANSEGQPGPQDYGRSHADGANMFAAALAPHGGIVMWRAFVYSNKASDDRAKQAYDGVHAARRQIRRECAAAGQEWPHRFPAARAGASFVRRHAQDPADAGGADYQGIPRFRHASGVSRPALRGSAAHRYLGDGPRLDGGESDRWVAARLRSDRHGGRGEYRRRPQLERLAISIRPIGTPSGVSRGIPPMPHATSPKTGRA